MEHHQVPYPLPSILELQAKLDLIEMVFIGLQSLLQDTAATFRVPYSALYRLHFLH